MMKFWLYLGTWAEFSALEVGGDGGSLTPKQDHIEVDSFNRVIRVNVI